MQLYSKYSGREFEHAVFGLSSHWDWMREKFDGRTADFSRDIRSFIERSGITHPSTEIGASLWHQTGIQLDRFEIDPNGLAFFPVVDTKLDLFHGADGFFFHPALWPHLVTIDAFNTHPGEYKEKIKSWIDESASDERAEVRESIFTDEDSQNNLFLFKRGMTRWYLDNKEMLEEAKKKGLPVIIPTDFRPFADRARWKNHFILTPYHVSSYGRRRNFARMVAGYFAKMAKVPNCQKMALLSH